MKCVYPMLFVLFCAIVTTGGQTSDSANEVIALEQQFNEALLKADWTFIERIYANDIIFTNADGKVTGKSDAIASIKSGEIKFEFAEASDLKVRDLGNVEIVTGKLVERGHYQAEDLGGTYRFTDVWAKRNAQWQLVVGQETRVQSAKTSP